MPKPDLEDSIDELSPDQMAKVLKDLAADAATKESVVAAVQLAHEQPLGKAITRRSFLGRVARTVGRKSKPEAFYKDEYSIRRDNHAEPEDYA